jgi:hypothetical protein
VTVTSSFSDNPFAFRDVQDLPAGVGMEHIPGTGSERYQAHAKVFGRIFAEKELGGYFPDEQRIVFNFLGFKVSGINNFHL